MGEERSVLLSRVTEKDLRDRGRATGNVGASWRAHVRSTKMAVGAVLRAAVRAGAGPTGQGKALVLHTLLKTEKSDRICLSCDQDSVTLRTRVGKGRSEEAV